MSDDFPRYPFQFSALYVESGGYASVELDDWGFDPVPTGSFTVSVWFRQDAPRCRLLDAGGIMTLDVSGQSVTFWLTGIEDVPVTVERFPLIPHAWNHITVTYSDGLLSLYVNGIVEMDRSMSGSTPVTGSRRIDVGDRMIGYVRSLRMYPHALDPDEVLAEHRAGSDKGLDGATVEIVFDCEKPVERRSGRAMAISENAKVCAVCDAVMFDGTFGLHPEDADDVNPGMMPRGDFTVQAWVMPYDDQGSTYTVFRNGTDGVDAGMHLYLERASDGYTVCGSVGIGDDSRTVRSETTIPLRRWSNLAFIRILDYIILYVDGQPAAKYKKVNGQTYIMPAGSVWIGAPSGDSDQGMMRGAIGSIAVWDRELGRDELPRFAGSPPAEGDGLLADYRFVEGDCYDMVSQKPVPSEVSERTAVCRGPVSDVPAPMSVIAPPDIASVRLESLNGRTAEELRRSYLESLPDPDDLVDRMTESLLDPSAFDREELRKAAEDAIRLVREDPRRASYHSERSEDGSYGIYVVDDDGIRDTGTRVSDAMVAWVTEFFTTMMYDVMMIVMNVPDTTKSLLPAAFKSAAKAEAISSMAREKYVGSLISWVFKSALGGMFDSMRLYLQKNKVMLAADVVTAILSLSGRLSSPYGQINMAARIVILGVDAVRLWNKRPTAAGLDLVSLAFTGPAFHLCTEGPVYAVSQRAKRLPAWTDSGSGVSPVLCVSSLLTEGSRNIVTAEIAVNDKGTYEIEARPRTEDDPAKALGTIVVTVTTPNHSRKDDVLKVDMELTPPAEIPPVTAGDATWTWTVRRDGKVVNTWETRVRLYIVCDRPSIPWYGTADINIPWKGALDLACGAVGGMTPTEGWQNKVVNRWMSYIWEKRYGLSPSDMYLSNGTLRLTRLVDNAERFGPTMGDGDIAAITVAVCNLIGCNLSRCRVECDRGPIAFRKLRAIPGTDYRPGTRSTHHSAFVEEDEKRIIHDVALMYGDDESGWQPLTGVDLRDVYLKNLVEDPDSCVFRREDPPLLR